MAIRRNRVTASQIAVLTPYRRQVQRIKTLLNAKGYASVQVGVNLADAFGGGVLFLGIECDDSVHTKYTWAATAA
jgi:superfamily I DNA and/or RNA helicase